MLCQKCHKNEAQVFLTEVKNQQKKQVALCQECAKKYAQYIQEPHFGILLQDIMESYLEMPPYPVGQEKSKHHSVEKRCDFCGMTSQEFQNSGKLGCPYDYQAFEGILQRICENVQGANQHVGRFPPGYSIIKKQERLTALRKQLQEVIEKEEYEKASKIKQQIDALEEKITHEKESTTP